MTSGHSTFPAVVLACAVAASSPAAAQHSWLADWASQKQDAIAAPAETNPFVDPTPLSFSRIELRRSSRSERALQDATTRAYERLIGANTSRSLLWTGVETANPLTRSEDYRWNALQDQNLFEATVRRAVTDELQALGLTNVRLGLANHDIDLDRPESWAEHDALIGDFVGAGINVSLDMHHFGVEDRFRTLGPDGRTDPRASYYLHPEWPDYFARFAGAAFARYGGAIKAVTLVNEPETTIGFNSEMWHGGFPGWGSAEHDVIYVERAFQVAIGAVKARIAIEAERRRRPQDVVFMHTEAVVTKPSRVAFDRVVRFFPSDLILGHRWLMEADLVRFAAAAPSRLIAVARLKPETSHTALDWLALHYVGAEEDPVAQARARDRLVERLRLLRELHDDLRRAFGKTMTSETVFAADYYAHNEDAGAASGAWLSPEPQLYAAQVQSGERVGLYPLLMAYYDRYRLPMMIGETGTPYYSYGARWHQQMLLECAAAMEQGVPLLGYTLYPLLDTWGWEMGLSQPRAAAVHNPSGVLDLDRKPRPFMEALIAALSTQTAAARIDATSDVR
ncbi:hypothetical protein [Methylopila sp. Yamaguchi]|uniref:hypothetical protein n=1 Tax=Methylopila sp. Yamaguchi TaxID=1437817 RepID=UPI000CB08D82|nr:hypothetical protein [Methylopila sp. Yamaguchi]GBD47440.1 glycoside hydrolase family protein [Methylopila sp. Yamaguchi]